jgi:hypothetical protein
MESSQPVQFPKLFAEDYQHFEKSHEQYPQEAQEVFSRVSELRVALQAYREATLTSEAVRRAQQSAESENPAVEPPSSLLESTELLGSVVEGCVEEPAVDLTADSAESEEITLAAVVEVVG